MGLATLLLTVPHCGAKLFWNHTAMKIDVKKIRTAALVVNAALTKALLIAAGYYFGNQWDLSHGSAPYGMVVGVSLGFAIGLFGLLRILKRLD